MFDPFLLAPFSVGLLVGALLCWLVMRGTVARLSAEISAAERFRDRTLASHESDTQVREAFSALSAEALAANNAAFLEHARQTFSELQTAASGELELRKQAVEQLVAPIREGLERVDSKLQAFDLSRAESHGALTAMLKTMHEAQHSLTSETQHLVAALRQPNGRGQWGELQLRRVVELAGMLEHCDFATQQALAGDDGLKRPDVIVRLPGGKVVVVDAKAPLSAYLDATHTDDDEARSRFLDQHAKQVRHHVTQLSRRDYSTDIAEAPDFVVLFLPGEAFFAAACQRDPGLLDYAVGKGVIPASPTTLITLLKAVNFGWQQERIARSAEEIRDLGLTLYDRMAVLADHLVKVRRGLEGAVRSYNDAMGSLERRVLPTARRFRDLGVGGRAEITALRPVGGDPLRVASAEEVVDQEVLEV
jgi:DNA recombination protein RmuC